MDTIQAQNREIYKLLKDLVSRPVVEKSAINQSAIDEIRDALISSIQNVQRILGNQIDSALDSIDNKTALQQKDCQTIRRMAEESKIAATKTFAAVEGFTQEQRRELKASLDKLATPISRLEQTIDMMLKRQMLK